MHASSRYVEYKVNVSENHVDTLKDRRLTPAQITRLDNAQVEGRRAQIRMSDRQVAKNVSYTGGFLGMLASLAARAIPLAARALPAILQLVYYLVLLKKRLVVVVLEMDSTPT